MLCCEVSSLSSLRLCALSESLCVFPAVQNDRSPREALYRPTTAGACLRHAELVIERFTWMVCRNDAQQQLPTQTLFADALQNAAKEHRHQRGVFHEGFNAIFNAMFACTTQHALRDVTSALALFAVNTRASESRNAQLESSHPPRRFRSEVLRIHQGSPPA